MTTLAQNIENTAVPASALARLQARMMEDHIDYLLVQFVDIHGSAKVKMVPAAYLEDVVTDGAGFAGAAVWGMGQGPHSHDMMGRADLDTYTPLPWEPGVARLASRYLCRWRAAPLLPASEPQARAGRAGGHGLSVQCRHRAGVLSGEAACRTAASPSPMSWASIRWRRPAMISRASASISASCAISTMPCCNSGWGNYQTDHEDANGQYEINYKYSDALTSADRHTFIKMLTNQLAKRHGLIATHMAKPFGHLTGSGAHYHFSHDRPDHWKKRLRRCAG